MNYDYRLKHQMAGRLGTTWSRYVDPASKSKASALASVAASADLVGDINVVAGSAAEVSDVTVKDASFEFLDGNFATIGKGFDDYTYTSGVAGYREAPATEAVGAIPRFLDVATPEFIYLLRSVAAYTTDAQSWYVIPIPTDLKPIMIETLDPDRVLILGVDFEYYPGYIVTNLHPAAYLRSGKVVVPLAKRILTDKNSYVLGGTSGRSGNTFLAEYRFKSQSVGAFKRAAAEHSGMYVFPTNDIILGAYTGRNGAMTYVAAVSGIIDIRYPHYKLTPGSHVEAGRIVSGMFNLLTKPTSGEDMRGEHLSTATTAVSLNGVTPATNVVWDPTKTVTVVDGGSGVSSFDFSGNGAVDLNEWQALQEAKAGSLATALGESLPYEVDFWSILDNFYGEALIVVAAATHGDAIDAKLIRFIQEEKPITSCVISFVDTDRPISYYDTDADGNPYVDEFGNMLLNSTQILAEGFGFLITEDGFRIVGIT